MEEKVRQTSRAVAAQRLIIIIFLLMRTSVCVWKWCDASTNANYGRTFWCVCSMLAENGRQWKQEAAAKYVLLYEREKYDKIRHVSNTMKNMDTLSTIGPLPRRCCFAIAKLCILDANSRDLRCVEANWMWRDARTESHNTENVK